MKRLEERFEAVKTGLDGGKLLDYICKQYPIERLDRGIAMASGCASCANGGGGGGSCVSGARVTRNDYETKDRI